MRLSEHPRSSAYHGFIDGVVRLHKLLGSPPESLQPLHDHCKWLEDRVDCEKIPFFDMVDTEPVKFFVYSMKAPNLRLSTHHGILFPKEACKDFLAQCGWDDRVACNSVEIVMYAAKFCKNPKKFLTKIWNDHVPKINDAKTRSTELDGIAISTTTISGRRVTSAERSESED